jgi:hypothetical protein
LKGRGLAIAGLVIGYIITLPSLVLIASYFLFADQIDRVVQVDQARAQASTPTRTDSGPTTNTANPSATNLPDSATNAAPMKP